MSVKNKYPYPEHAILCKKQNGGECNCIHTMNTEEYIQMESAAREWSNVAMDMIQELREDYAPGDLGELDGVKAIRKLRASIATKQIELEEAAKTIKNLNDEITRVTYFDIRR